MSSERAGFAGMKRFPRIAFFALGCAITVAAFFLSSYFNAIVEALGWERPYAPDAPGWLKATRNGVGYLPWAALLGMLLARFEVGRRIRLFSFAAGLATPYLALVAFLFGGPILADHWHRQAFDAAEWRAAADEGWSNWPVRLTMADDLVNSGILRGKTRREIEALLGPRTNVDKFASWDMIYYLGPERGFLGIDSEWIAINFGPDGRAAEIAIVHD